MPDESSTPSPADVARKEEYDRWHERGQKDKAAGIKLADCILRNMRPGSNAYEAYADGYGGV